MFRTAHMVALGAAAVLLGAIACALVWAQDAPVPAEAVPAPVPEAAGPQDQPATTYGPREASRDAYQAAEDQRRQAVNRQLQTLDYARWSNVWAPYVHRYALPYVYSYAPPRAARRVHRAVDRAANRPVLAPWPQVPGDVYGNPYYPSVRQPIGHEQIRTGPNSYLYRPRHAEPAGQPTPTPALRPPATPEPPPPPPVESPISPPLPVPEAIPVPPDASGPREF